MKKESKHYQYGYLQRQLDEAEENYRNIVLIMDDMIEFRLDRKLEEFLKEHDRF